MEAACERHARYAAIVSQELERLGFTLVALPQARSVTVIAAYPPPGVEAAALLRRLRVERGIVLAGGQAELAGKIVRFGTMGDLTEEDIRDALAAIEEIARATSGVA